MSAHQCIAVFTARSPERILREGGSQAWVLDPSRARTIPFVVCIQNQNNEDRDFSDASEPHGTAYLVGKISDVVPSGDDDPARWKVCISEYARCSVRDAWKAWRNPVKYTTLEELGIDIASLTFHPIPESQDTLQTLVKESIGPSRMLDAEPPAPISIAVAKVGLAAFYGVVPEAVEIVIRG